MSNHHRPVALVYSGLGDNEPHMIVRDLQNMGFEVIHLAYKSAPYVGTPDLVVGFSAGGARAVIEYGGSDIPVKVLSSPVRFNVFSNVQYYGNILDPVTILGVILSGNTDGLFLDLQGNPHSSEQAWERARKDLVTVPEEEHH